MTQLVTNNAAGTLASSIVADTTSLALQTGEGAEFPTITGGDFFLVTLFEVLNNTEINHEIVKCTARSGDTLTVVRAQEGTTARAFSAGTAVQLRMTAGTFSAINNNSIITKALSFFNTAGTFRNIFSNAITADRTFTFPDKDGEVVVKDTSGVTTLGSAGTDSVNIKGNLLNLESTVTRIKAAFSSGWAAFQSNEANSYTALRVIPNGTGTTSYLILYNSQDGTGAYLAASSESTASVIDSNKGASGTVKPIYLRVAGNSLLTLDTTNVVSLPYGQLQFPATQNPSANANTLDDYEEGLWTPVPQGSTTAGTVGGSSVLEGKYIKVGRHVAFTGYVYVPSWSVAPAGNLFIGGLPFTNGAHHTGISIGYQQLQGSGNAPAQGQIAASNTSILLSYISAGTSTPLPATNVAYQIYFSGSYIVS